MGTLSTNRELWLCNAFPIHVNLHVFNIRFTQCSRTSTCPGLGGVPPVLVKAGSIRSPNDLGVHGTIRASVCPRFSYPMFHNNAAGPEIELPGRISSGFQSAKPAGLRPAGGANLRLSQIESGRRETNFRPGSDISSHRLFPGHAQPERNSWFQRSAGSSPQPSTLLRRLRAGIGPKTLRASDSPDTWDPPGGAEAKTRIKNHLKHSEVDLGRLSQHDPSKAL